MTAFRMIIAFTGTGALLSCCVSQRAGQTGSTTAAEDRSETVFEDQVDPQIQKILTYAARASSSHNAQPWRVELAAPRTLKLLADRSRYLPAVDPTNREMFLSFGAFLENLEHSALSLGYNATITVMADCGAATEIAEIRLDRISGTRNTAILNLIAGTYTPKGDLSTEPLEAESLRALGASESEAIRYLPPDSAGFQWLREQAPKAALQQAWREPVQEELAGYLHFSRKSARQAGYGLTPEMMEVAAIGRFLWYTFMTRKSALSKSFRNSIEGITAAQLKHCAGAYIVSSPDGSPAALIEAGGQYQRLKLAAFRRGIGVHPISALLEEEPWKQLVGRMLDSNRPVQLILRTGRLLKELPDFETDAITSASIRMRPEQFISVP